MMNFDLPDVIDAYHNIIRDLSCNDKVTQSPENKPHAHHMYPWTCILQYTRLQSNT